MAECARDALNKAKKTEPEDVCVSARWQDPKAVQLPEAIGFDDGVYESDEEEE